MTANPNIDKLQHLWLHQLQLEFEEICMTYGLQLRLPVFEISDGDKRAWCMAPGNQDSAHKPASDRQSFLVDYHPGAQA